MFERGFGENGVEDRYLFFLGGRVVGICFFEFLERFRDGRKLSIEIGL